MSMHLSELIERLQSIALDLPEDADPEVRLATQRNWPLAFTIRGLALQSEIVESSESFDPDESFSAGEDEVLWIVEGGHPREPDSPYASKDAWEVAR